MIAEVLLEEWYLVTFLSQQFSGIRDLESGLNNFGIQSLIRMVVIGTSSNTSPK